MPRGGTSECVRRTHSAMGHPVQSGPVTRVIQYNQPSPRHGRLAQGRANEVRGHRTTRGPDSMGRRVEFATGWTSIGHATLPRTQTDGCSDRTSSRHTSTTSDRVQHLTEATGKPANRTQMGQAPVNPVHPSPHYPEPIMSPWREDGIARTDSDPGAAALVPYLNARRSKRPIGLGVGNGAWNVHLFASYALLLSRAKVFRPRNVRPVSAPQTGKWPRNIPAHDHPLSASCPPESPCIERRNVREVSSQCPIPCPIWGPHQVHVVSTPKPIEWPQCRRRCVPQPTGYLAPICPRTVQTTVRKAATARPTSGPDSGQDDVRFLTKFRPESRPGQGPSFVRASAPEPDSAPADGAPGATPRTSTEGPRRLGSVAALLPSATSIATPSALAPRRSSG